MTPTEIRQSVSRMLLVTIIHTALAKLPRCAEAPDEASIMAIIGSTPFEYNPNNTLGLLMDRVVAELPEENVTPEMVVETYVACYTDELSPIHAGIISLADKAAGLLGTTFGLLNDEVIPTAEDVVNQVNAALIDRGDFGTDPKARGVTAQLFNWGCLSDPVAVNEVLAVCREKANAFNESLVISPYYISGCFGVASRTVLSDLGDSDRAFAKTVLEKSSAPCVASFCSTEGLRSRMITLQSDVHAGATVSRGMAHLDCFYDELQTLKKALTEESSDALRGNLDTLQTTLSLLYGGYYAARKTLYKNSLVLSIEEVDGSPVMILNEDCAEIARALGITLEDCSIVGWACNVKGIDIPRHGLTVGFVQDKKDAYATFKSEYDLDVARKQDLADVSEFTDIVTRTLASVGAQYGQILRPNLGEGVFRSALNRAVSGVTQNNENLLDCSVAFFITIAGCPYLSTLTNLLAEQSDEDPQCARTKAFIGFLATFFTPQSALV